MVEELQFAGTKAMTLNKPDAAVVGEPGLTHTSGSDEFGLIRLTETSKAYKIGDNIRAQSLPTAIRS